MAPSEFNPADHYREQAEETNKAAVDARDDRAPQGETDEEYAERISNVPGIFGDTDTTAGSSASQVDVPSAQNELATTAAAEAEATDQVEEDQPDGVADPEARRQPDVALGTVPSAEEAQGVVEDNNDPAVEDVRQSDDVEEVREATEADDPAVREAAAARLQELESNA